MLRTLILAVVAAAVAETATAQGLFDDNEARRRVELLRQHVEATRQAIEARLAKIEEGADRGAERTALIDLAGQIESLRGEIAKMRGQLEVLGHQAETAEGRQKQLYLDIDTRLRKLEQAREQAAAAPEKPAASAQSAESEPTAAE